MPEQPRMERRWWIAGIGGPMALLAKAFSIDMLSLEMDLPCVAVSRFIRLLTVILV